MGMKNFFASLLLVTSAAHAVDVPITLFCDTPDKLVRSIEKKYGETPNTILLDPDEKTSTVVFFNESTTTWTIVQIVPSLNMACVMGSGTGMSVKKQKSKSNFY